MSTRKNKKPWPTKAVMEQIYDNNFWGGENGVFYSGEGSHNPQILQPYLKAVIHFLSEKKSKLCVCDLGCGDFNVGKQLIPFVESYVGVDIVEKLIKHNEKKYGSEVVHFKTIDIVKDDLPKADCAILRQVLQHLSNKEIREIASKLSLYKYVLLTEHLPSGMFVPNKNMLTSRGNRLRQNSGVDLLVEPFSLKVKHTEELLRIPLVDNSQIVTYLYEMSL